MADKRKELTEDEKKVIVSMDEKGMSARSIAETFGRSNSCISRVLRRFRERGTLKNSLRSGRPPKWSDRDRRNLGKVVRDDRRQTLADITSTVNEGKDETNVCSKRTVQRQLHRIGFSCRTVRKHMVVKKVNRRLRQQWCRAKLHWNINNWKDILFTDEMMVVLRGDTGRIKVWRKVGEKWRPECLGVMKICPGQTVKIMVWGCISYFGIGSLAFVEGSMNSERYIEVLENHLWPSVCKLFGVNRWVLQEDNATIHKSRLTEQFKRENNIPTLRWPAQSPDLNIIENVWLVLKRHVRRRSHLIGSIEDLKRELLTAWEKIPHLFIRRLFESLPRRIRTVLIQKGHITKY